MHDEIYLESDAMTHGFTVEALTTLLLVTSSDYRTGTLLSPEADMVPAAVRRNLTLRR